MAKHPPTGGFHIGAAILSPPTQATRIMFAVC